jgi:beta-glucanase (GH16 family)
MNYWKHLSVYLIVISFVCCKPASEVSNKNYDLIWSDEFNGNLIDTLNWNFETGGHGWGNNEQQYYQRNNATVSDGNLVITAKRETVGSNNYTSSRMTTKRKREFLYGKITARIKIPVGQGIWPAFWMLGASIDSVDWPRCGEIDIMEHINTENLLYGTLHWDDKGHIQKGDTTVFTPTGFHEYAIEWDADSIRWYIDEKKYSEIVIRDSVNSTNEFHQPFYILLNVAVGGNWPGQLVDTAAIPATMLVDYVRVFRKRK